MMQWYWKLYRGDGKPALYNRIIRNVRKGKFQPDAYVVALAANEKDLIDLYPAWTLRQSCYQNSNLQIIGVAANRSEALEIVRRIIQDTYDATGGVDVKARFRPEAFST